jgi:hypothetical protein
LHLVGVPYYVSCTFMTEKAIHFIIKIVIIL